MRLVLIENICYTLTIIVLSQYSMKLSFIVFINKTVSYYYSCIICEIIYHVCVCIYVRFTCRRSLMKVRYLIRMKSIYDRSDNVYLFAISQSRVLVTVQFP
jgi:hypothetical protein